MKSLGLWWFLLAIGVVLAAQFRDWMWWYNWEDDEEGTNPAPLLCALWPVWRALEWVWWRIYWPLHGVYRRFFPLPSPPPWREQDGFSPLELLAIDIIGLWELNWFDYDLSIKQKWDAFLKARGVEDGLEQPIGCSGGCTPPDFQQ